MRLFVFSTIFVCIATYISGYFALYLPKRGAPQPNKDYPVEFKKPIEDMVRSLNDEKYSTVIDLANQLIIYATDHRVVATAYFLRSKANFGLKNINEAKKDLLYAKQLEFDNFSKTTRYTFINSLRSLALYESELFSGHKKDYLIDIAPSIYYVFALLFIGVLTFAFRQLRE
jgi:hypothetical protein